MPDAGNDPKTRTTELIGDKLPGKFPNEDKWVGGVLGRDGKVYCVPCYAEQVLCIDPETRTTELIGAKFQAQTSGTAACLAATARCTACRRCGARALHRPHHAHDELIGAELPGTDKWYGGVLGGDGKVYCVPSDAEQVLCIDLITRTTELIGAELPGTNKWYGGVLGGDGKVYCVPCNAKHVCIDPEARTTELIGDEFPGEYKWQGGVLGGDGKVYCVPFHAEQVLCITTPSAAPCPTESADAPTGQAPLKAFVLGLKNYSWSKPLTCTINDAFDMATKLHDLGAQVMLLTDDISDTEERRKLAKRLAGEDGCGDKSQEKVNGNVIEDCIAEWMQTLKEGDVAIFFCSCHGEEYDGRSYILPSSDEPHEEDPEAHAKALKNDAIDAEATLNEILRPKLRTHRRFRSSKGQAPAVAIMFPDICRWRHVIEGGKSGGGGLGRAMNVAAVPRSLVGHACASGAIANDIVKTKERNSPFTKALLDQLGTTDDVRNDLEAVREAVRIKTASLKIKQAPTYSSSLGLPCPHPLLCLKRSRASSSMDGSDHAGTAGSSSGKRKAQKRF